MTGEGVEIGDALDGHVARRETASARNMPRHPNLGVNAFTEYGSSKRHVSSFGFTDIYPPAMALDTFLLLIT